MKCPKCNKEMVWQGDTLAHEVGCERDGVVTFYECEKCNIWIEMYQFEPGGEGL